VRWCRDCLNDCGCLTACLSLLQRPAPDSDYMYPCHEFCLGRIGGAARGIAGPNAKARPHGGCSCALERNQRDRGDTLGWERLWLLGIGLEGGCTVGVADRWDVDLPALDPRIASQECQCTAFASFRRTLEWR